MAQQSSNTPTPSSPLIQQLLEALDTLAGGVHPGFRPVHAKGAMCSGQFTPSPEAAKLTRAPHALLGVFVQLATDQDNVADSTVRWPDSRPEVKFGTITLTGRANDADPELRKIIFDPIPRVDGIDPSADPLIEVRSAIYLLSGRRRRAASA
jgi:catalase